MAGARAVGLVPERPNARRRRRDQARDLPCSLRNDGKAVVLLSTDTPELVHLCDRVMVFHKGKVAATLPHSEASEEAIVAAAMGVQKTPTLQGEAV